MAKLVWDQIGERFYQNGVDRGVLYPLVGPGVAWNGLMAVANGTSGGELRSVHLDGTLYRYDGQPEAFVGAIKALACPTEFLPCDGILPIGKGLYITQQPRQEFGLSYRTLIGNDVSSSVGYKIHLVYNALADSNSREHLTGNKLLMPVSRAWGISARPVLVPGRRPAAHFAADTTKVAPAVITQLETILYGSVGVAPRLPTVDELFALHI